MALSSRNTFEYVAVVPPRDAADSFECAAAQRALTNEERRGFAFGLSGGSPARLVGLAPTLRVTPAGLTPDASTTRPLVMRSELRLIASSRENATMAEAAFHVDASLISRLQPKDVVHVSRTVCGGLGVSAIRDDMLLFAAGAVTAVPLGDRLWAEVPRTQVAQAEAVFQKVDPSFTLPMLPLEFTARGHRAITLSRPLRVGGYVLSLLRPVICGMPGQDECAAIWPGEHLDNVAVIASAMLLAQDDALATVRWPDDVMTLEQRLARRTELYETESEPD